MATPIPVNRAELTLAEIVRETGGRVIAPAGAGAVAYGVSTDTRVLEPGQAFVAIQGETFDGHESLADARAKGATIAIVERDVAGAEGLVLVRVPSAITALGALGRYWARRWRALGGLRSVVAITGSAGKTTTRVAITALLETIAPRGVHATSGNLNNLIGVPMTLLGLLPAHRLAVIELGANRPGEIAALTAITSPTQVS